MTKLIAQPPATMPLAEQFSVAFLDGYFENDGSEAVRHWERLRGYLMTLELAIGPAPAT